MRSVIFGHRESVQWPHGFTAHSLLYHHGMQNEALRYSDDEDLDILRLATLGGGDSRSSQFTGTKALMLAVLEDAIRSYLGSPRVPAQEAEWWIRSSRRQSPFSFVVVCETLGLDPAAVRKTLEQLKTQNLPRRALPRSRHNVRVPGRVYARRESAGGRTRA